MRMAVKRIHRVKQIQSHHLGAKRWCESRTERRRDEVGHHGIHCNATVHTHLTSYLHNEIFDCDRTLHPTSAPTADSVTAKIFEFQLDNSMNIIRETNNNLKEAVPRVSGLQGGQPSLLQT